MHESQLYNPTAMYKVVYFFLIFVPLIPKFRLPFHSSIYNHLLPT